ncbi:NADH-FMN oxidoreductase RutF, flavin reductase (DIM6/NTAB) family [Alteribacillus persepolensis]|uniref:NADH-FMN oxidoreductase RutF, flavin reductase (DIM6/NTAB) family n=1 Tax=Alteribacillus persepolensis TaxID=568899 RepID=A0A1G8B1W6_9BACI|nr:flavin reductase family protein [Alteribacillus persepolensis]SDH27121.1 NADH-FMN oxidoreductase RutF, flavin reductase (DIM6/NTAB) family [Alteribacillus persepolensis]
MPNNGAHAFYPNEMEKKQIYKLLIGSVVPRPIAWISSKNGDGIYNVAPFSFFTVASSQPPTLAVTIAPAPKEHQGGVKDTLSNIRETEEYVINVVPEALGNEMYESSLQHAPDVSEFDKAGLTPEPSRMIDVPSIKETPIAFECKLDRIVSIGRENMVFGQVVCAHVNEDAYLGNFKTDIEAWKPLARLAGNYASLHKPYHLPK